MGYTDEETRPFYTDEETRPFETEWRPAKVRNVVDGDTLDLTIDLGFEVQVNTRCRLKDIDTWEVRHRDKDHKEKGKLAKEAVKRLVGRYDFRVRSYKSGSKGKYGRYLVDVIFLRKYNTPNNAWTDLKEHLKRGGHEKIETG